MPLDRNKKIVPVILSGGSGACLWPISRKSFPKQFWPMISSKPMLVETALRATSPAFEAPIIVTDQNHRFVVAEQLREAGISGARILLEPKGRNTAPAVAAAALLVAETTPEAVLWVMGAATVISDLEALYQAIDRGAGAAAAGYFVTFGMHPTALETDYAYIAQGAAMIDLEGIFKVDRFVEKPTAEKPLSLAQSGQNLWNSGMFMFSAELFLAETALHAPEVLQAVQVAWVERSADLDFIRLEASAFESSPDVSIDYAIAKKTDKAVVVPASVGWSGAGYWAALAEIMPQDESGNSVFGEVVIEDSLNCYARSDGVITALLGVNDIVVVTTQDAVLVAHKDHTQNVKKIVDRLKRENKTEAGTHNRTYRPWGFYEKLILDGRFQVKRIVVLPGQQISLQKHYHRAEHWVIVTGCAEVTCDKNHTLVRENESIHLPLGSVHRMKNSGRIPLTVIEVQVGPYLGEDDIVRFEDIYGRAS